MLSYILENLEFPHLRVVTLPVWRLRQARALAFPQSQIGLARTAFRGNVSAGHFEAFLSADNGAYNMSPLPKTVDYRENSRLPASNDFVHSIR